MPDKVETMPDRCPRCNKYMNTINMWYSVNIGNGTTVHVCADCFQEAKQIDQAYSEACARAKRKWLSNTSIKIATLLPNSPQ